jgi:hypothetical protein
MTVRTRGYALAELLVAVAIAGLIIGTLTFLNVDYVSLGRRVSEIQSPYQLGTRAERVDPCATPGGVLVADDDKVIAKGPQDTATVLTITRQDPDTPGAAMQVITPAGVAGTSRQPVRVAVEAPRPGTTLAGAPSMASIEIGGATVGVIAPRCELSQVCDYDAANAMCSQDEAQGLAEPG